MSHKPNHLIAAFAITFAAASFSGCTDNQKKIDEVVKAEKAPTDKNAFTVDKDGNVTFKIEIVYFTFDDYTLTKEGMERLDILAAYLKDHADKKLSIEGHCDERGSTEYNLALGQLRAQSVKNYLNTIGVSKDRLATISFGKERPAVLGRGEDVWAKNRRAEFKFVSL